VCYDSSKENIGDKSYDYLTFFVSHQQTWN
jgi:hypothetical protein